MKMNFQEIFCDVMPVLQKAAPLISELTGSPLAAMIVGFLATLVNANPCDHGGVAQKLASDPDLYAKLVQLESTHGKWLSSIDSKV